MRKRAEQVDETRQRIIDAAIDLHGSIGPAATTVAGLAEKAGVTRLTVYRHFPDDLTLFLACSGHWRSQQVLPDLQAWAAIADPLERLHAGLTDLYRFYRQGQDMLAWVEHDKTTFPAEVRQIREADVAHSREVLLNPFTEKGAQRKRIGAVIGHAIAFGTWRSLCAEEGLSHRDAVDLMVALAQAVCGRTSPDS